ncbi:hypothetical protein F8388_003126 [Cannabis sativa]|uniref:Serpin domain-containing protein n=1 Tax=Cannabis sativa TaxID=3483 RepID=A0A7J6HU79_CANSA|nr:hypothetical protein F8388_003126 [Cannabis sativa]KAF4398585.1 hypothetical protein G4B88_013674 [Cannabis sativa]
MEFCTQIAAKLILNEMKKNESSAENVVMSPLSINLMLNMVAAGAEDMVEKFNLDPKLLAPKSLNNHLRKVKLSRVSIPKMKFSYDVDAMELLEEKGLTLPFTEGKADFSKMVYSHLESNNVFIGTMLHKSCIEVNEEGTKATSATSLRFEIEAECDSDSSPPPLPTFDADHPFMFMIVEQFSNLVVFTGAVLDPRK